jgi:hypothetical protein
MMNQSTFSAGFRLSRLDVVFVLASLLATIGLAALTWWWGLVVGFVSGNFFLFCNVFRVARPLELAWSALFLTLAVATIVLDAPGWLITVAISLIGTCAVILLEMRKPSYHGFAWQWINPTLPAWWETEQSKSR